MPAWRLKSEGETLFYHVCQACSDRSAESLAKAGWQKIREGEPVSCNECTMNCTLTVSDHGVGFASNALPQHRKRLQGAADARNRPASYSPLCEQVDDKADPVSCDRLPLTAKGLWGEADTIRYAACETCPDYEPCPLKGRHYC